MRFTPTPKDLFFSRNDKNDPRLGEIAIHSMEFAQQPPNSRTIGVIGYPDDEGIRLNGGRVGAHEGPDRIRKYLYRMTPAANSPVRDTTRIVDLGNLNAEAMDLEARHKAAEGRVRNVFAMGGKVLTFGGGHDYGYPDAAAFAAACEEKGVRPLVINFDAHLDVRPTDRGLTSGTPYFRLLEAFPETDFVEIGVQAQCNSKVHLDWAKSKGARILTYEDWMTSGESLVVHVTKKLEDLLLRPRPLFISIDIDGFSSAYAMGCSQSWATGFEPNEFLRLYQVLIARMDIWGVGIYEVSPPLDEEDRTSKLAALLAHRFIYAL